VFIIINKNNIIKILAGIPLSVLIGLYAMNILTLQNLQCIEGVYMVGYGGVHAFDGINIAGILIFLVPQIVFSYMFARHMQSDLEICSVYVFTRANKRKGWFGKKVAELFVYLSLYYFLQFAVIFIISYLNNFMIIDIKGIIKIIASEFIIISLLNFFFVLLINILSLKIGAIYSFMISVLMQTGLTVIFAALFKVMNKFVLKLVPVSHAMLIWHDNEFLTGQYQSFMSEYINNFSIQFSVVYLLLLIVFLIIGGLHMIEKLDILGWEGI